MNKFENKEKLIVSNYEKLEIKVSNAIEVIIPLNEPYFACSDNQNLYIYKKEKNIIDKKCDVELIQEINFQINTMLYLFDEEILIGGKKGISLLKFSKDYKTYYIVFNVAQNEDIENIIKVNNKKFVNISNTFKKDELNNEDKWIKNKYINIWGFYSNKKFEKIMNIKSN